MAEWQTRRTTTFTTILSGVVAESLKTPKWEIWTLIVDFSRRNLLDEFPVQLILNDS
jgi:hypothetical protein